MKLSALQIARLSRLLDEALPLDEAGRRRWLQELTAEHRDLEPALRQALLQAQAAAGGAGAEALLSGVHIAQRSAVVKILSAGERVGPYELLRELGAGGMAEVWLAQRADGAYRREVALKLPVLMAVRNEALAQRFERERDILASLEHPNIARLYDAGVSREGLPYLAMEFVAGQPLTEWCDAHRLAVRERLQLFLHVLDAVQYAHTQHVIHRDLKPSNILVSQSGQVRLLDFGVAKLLGEEELAQPTQLTRLYGQALTPDYASPEQLRGEPITAASDIYALGVVLYELLCGSRPYRLEGASVAQLEHALASARVGKLSTQLAPEAADKRATTSERLARRLRGDLDAIALKALARLPQERYASAAALADDLQRYLSGEPVEARPNRLSYRAAKYVLRHRTGVAASAAGVIVLGAAISYLLPRLPVDRGGTPQTAATLTPPDRALAAAPVSDKSIAALPFFNPPPHSIAVLPFVNVSGDKEQEYFSDGLTDELLNSLSRINELQVAARTSAFSFKGKDADISTIAHKLNVGSVLEGSVRRSAHTVRITAQLINAVTGFHLWSETYDRDLGDVLKLQTEIANAVAGALKVTLLGDVAAKVELGGTSNPAAFDAYLRGWKAHLAAHDAKGEQAAIDGFTGAIRQDPHYALAFARRSLALSHMGDEYAPSEAARREVFDRARADARKAIKLAPDLAEGHLALGDVFGGGSLDFVQASAEYERAMALAPGNAEVLRTYGGSMRSMGHADAAIAAARRAVVLDPLNSRGHIALGNVFYSTHHYEQAVAAHREAVAVDANNPIPYGQRGLAYYALGNFQDARTSCEIKPDFWISQVCLAVTYDKLGRHADAQSVLTKMQTLQGEEAAYQYAEICAQWGNTSKALEWLEKALRLRDTGLVDIKADPLMDPLRREPRFQAIVRELKFPD